MSNIKLSALELAKLQVQIEIIRSCIANSKSIIIANAAKHSLRTAMFFINRFPRLVTGEDWIKVVTNSLDNKIFEYKRIISISLVNLVGKRPITIDSLFWFSVSDLKSGYILLYPHDHTKFANYVLFLVESRDPFDNKRYFPGDIHPFDDVKHVLTSVQGLTDKELGVGFRYASSAEVLKELSNLQSIIKSNNHERDIIP